MINKITLRNFQKWKRLEVETGQITTLIGPTDIGKSAVIRALGWIALNRPKGDAFRRFGTKTAGITLDIDGRRLTRKRGAENAYTLDGENYKAFGSDVPEPIADFLGVDELNFQQQHDPVYLLSESAGIIAKRLNKVVDLSSIDLVLDHSAKKSRSLKIAAEFAQEQVDTAEKEIADLKWVQNESRVLAGIKQRFEEVKSLEDEALAIEAWQDVVTEIKISQQAVDRAIASGTRLLKKAKGMIDESEKAGRLAGMLNTIDDLQREITDNARAIRKAEEQLATVKTCPTCGVKL